MSDQQQIIEAIAEALTLPSTDVDMETSLHDDLGLNPIEIADLLHSLSKRFNVIFDPTETTGIKTIDDLVILIEDKMLE